MRNLLSSPGLKDAVNAERRTLLEWMQTPDGSASMEHFAVGKPVDCDLASPTWTLETAVFVRRLAPLHLLQARSALRKLVLDLLAEPRRITLLELERAFVEHLLWGTQILSAHSHSLWQVLLPWLSRLGIRKSLYTQRSRLLHGERVEGDQGLRTGTRVIVAATLHAVIERQTFWKKLREDPDDPERLFDALRSASVKASRVDGVSDYPVMDIWRSRKQDETSP